MDAREAVLLVDDSEEDVLLTKIAFANARLANPLFVVQDGEDAIAYLDGCEPYSDRLRFPFPILMLLDLRMPKRNGFEVLRWLQEQQFRGDLMVAVMTNSQNEPDTLRCFELGADSYLIKPPKAEDLLQLVQRLKACWFIARGEKCLAGG
jgi:CheY-like chemotaxis protein